MVEKLFGTFLNSRAHRVLQFSLCIRLGGLFVCFVYQAWRFSFLHSQLALENEKVVIE